MCFYIFDIYKGTRNCTFLKGMPTKPCNLLGIKGKFWIMLMLQKWKNKKDYWTNEIWVCLYK